MDAHSLLSLSPTHLISQLNKTCEKDEKSFVKQFELLVFLLFCFLEVTWMVQWKKEDNLWKKMRGPDKEIADCRFAREPLVLVGGKKNNQNRLLLSPPFRKWPFQALPYLPPSFPLHFQGISTPLSGAGGEEWPYYSIPITSRKVK